MSRFGMKEVADVIFFDKATGKPKLFFDTLKLSNLEQAAESVYATGGRGAGRLIGWDYGRTATFALQDALLSEQSLSLLAGNDVEEGVQNIWKREVLIVATGEVTLTETPVAGTITAYSTEDGKFHKDELTAGTVTGNVLPVTGGTPAVADGDQVIVYYQYASAATAKSVTISADKFPGFYEVVADTLVRSEDGVDEPFQIVIKKAKLQPGFTMTMDAENVSVFDFNLEVFRDTNSPDMIKMIKH